MKTTSFYLSLLILLTGLLQLSKARSEDENVIYTMNAYQVRGLGVEQRKKYFADFGRLLLSLKDKNGKNYQLLI